MRNWGRRASLDPSGFLKSIRLTKKKSEKKKDKKRREKKGKKKTRQAERKKKPRDTKKEHKSPHFAEAKFAGRGVLAAPLVPPRKMNQKKKARKKKGRRLRTSPSDL